ncbi:MAG: abortive infection family protein [Nitrospirae bacterium]|nr:abortive infection family protein [Nitrospirota bacterium]
MNDVAEKLESILATASEMLIAEGMTSVSEILRTSTPRLEETGYDNWNGGTTIWTIYLLLEPSAYAQIQEKQRKMWEGEINKRLEPILGQLTGDWYGVTIAPKLDHHPEWRHSKNDVSRLTRQNVIDGLKIDNVSWNGRLNEVEFLQRLFDLEHIPSNDPRFKSAASDIWQHRINNPEDWSDDWIFDDSRFNLLNGPSDTFLRFLCEIVHPVVRPDRNESLKLLQNFNDQLRKEGWNIVEEEKIGGRPRFIPKRIQLDGGRSISRARSVADALEAGWMQKEIERLENWVDRDPALAIGTAKDLVESCCKTILSKRGIEVSNKLDMSDLTKKLTKELKLVPEGISDSAKGAESIKKILHNLSALTQYLSELRGLYGSGHGRNGKHRGLEPRHARLAVGVAVAFIDFVTETHKQRGD